MKFKHFVIAALILTSQPALAQFMGPVQPFRQVTVEWNANPEPDIEAYMIWYGTVSGGDYNNVETVLAPKTSLDLQLPLFTAYYFIATAINKSGLSSPPSEEIALPITEIELYRQQYFGITENIGKAADLANPANDGVPNILKFACWLNPTVPVEPEKRFRLGVLSVMKSELKFSYYRSHAARNDGVIFSVQWGTNLKDWVEAGTETVTNALYYDIVENTIPRSGALKFARLHVTYPAR